MNLNSPYYTNIFILNSLILKNILYNNKIYLAKDFNHQLEYISQINNLLVTTFLLLSISLYLLIWLPFEKNLFNDFEKTEMLVLLIPTDLILRKTNLLELLNKESLLSIKNNFNAK